MRLRPIRRGRGRAATAAALLVALGALSAAPVGAAPAEAQDGEQVVTYHGYQVRVPATWQVVDLERRPDTCVRFDRPTVYLGRPGNGSTCPARLVGRTEGLVVEPLAGLDPHRVTPSTARAAGHSAVAPGAVSTNDEIQVAVESAGVLVTASHTDANETAVRKVLGSATLTAGGSPAPLPTGRAARTAAAAGAQPGEFTGHGFDACTAPSQKTMDAWRADSPYGAVGVYISGQTRACAQPNLTASWVSKQTAKGWRLIPIEVGRQALHHLLQQDVCRSGHRTLSGRRCRRRLGVRRPGARHPGRERPLQRHRGLRLHRLLQGGRPLLPVRLDRGAAHAAAISPASTPAPLPVSATRRPSTTTRRTRASTTSGSPRGTVPPPPTPAATSRLPPGRAVSASTSTPVRSRRPGAAPR